MRVRELLLLLILFPGQVFALGSKSIIADTSEPGVMAPYFSSPVSVASKKLPKFPLSNLPVEPLKEFLLAESSVADWMDWSLWIEWNQEATGLWNRLLQCQSNSVEKARAAYFSAKNLCANDEREGESLQKGLQSLHGQIQDFALSSSVPLVPFRDRMRLDQLQRVIPSHPLFAQILLEFFVIQESFHSRTWFNILESKANEEYWVDPRPSLEFGAKVEAIISGGKNSALGPEYSKARAFVNAHMILSLLPADCNRWGLWPEANAALGYYISNQMIMPGRSQEIFSELRNMKLSLFCRGSSNIVSASNNELFKADLIQEYRKLGRRYFQKEEL